MTSRHGKKKETGFKTRSEHSEIALPIQLPFYTKEGCLIPRKCCLRPLQEPQVLDGVVLKSREKHQRAARFPPQLE